MRVGGYIVGSLVSVVSAALLFRHLGKVDTGHYVTAVSLVAIVGAVSDLGLTTYSGDDGLHAMARSLACGARTFVQ